VYVGNIKVGNMRVGVMWQSTIWRVAMCLWEMRVGNVAFGEITSHRPVPVLEVHVGEVAVAVPVLPAAVPAALLAGLGPEADAQLRRGLEQRISR
jgi:hypothetical protein